MKETASTNLTNLLVLSLHQINTYTETIQISFDQRAPPLAPTAPRAVLYTTRSLMHDSSYAWDTGGLGCCLLAPRGNVMAPYGELDACTRVLGSSDINIDLDIDFPIVSLSIFVR